MISIENAAKTACEKAGIIYNPVPADGKFHAVDRIGKRGGASLKLHADGRGGTVKNHESGQTVSFLQPAFKHIASPITYHEAKARKGADMAARRAGYAAQARVAGTIWRAAGRAPSPYFAAKGVGQPETSRTIPLEKFVALAGYTPHGSKGPLTCPITIIPLKKAGKLSSLELIGANGSKSAFRGGDAGGAYWAPAKLPKPSEAFTIVICEGAADALTIAAGTGFHCVSSRSCSNLSSVARAITTGYPKASVIIAGDLGNGSKQAIAAGEELGLPVVFPDACIKDLPEGTKDFNDLQAHAGLDAVRDAFTAPAVKPAAEITEAELVIIIGDANSRDTILLCVGLQEATRIHSETGRPVAFVKTAFDQFKAAIQLKRSAYRLVGVVYTGAAGREYAALKAAGVGDGEKRGCGTRFQIVPIDAVNNTKAWRAVGAEGLEHELDLLALAPPGAMAKQLGKAIKMTAREALGRQFLATEGEQIKGLCGRAMASWPPDQAASFAQTLTTIPAQLTAAFNTVLAEFKAAQALPDRPRVEWSPDLAQRIAREGGLWVDVRRMGSGKTELMAAVDAVMRKSGRRNIALSHRQTIASSHATVLKIDDYRRKHGAVESVAVCADSLPKVDMVNLHGFFVDEARQVLNHVYTARTVGDARGAVIDRLDSGLKRAPLVLAADADFDALTLQYAEEKCGRQATLIVDADDSVAHGKTIHRVANADQHKELICKQILAGKKIIVGTDATAALAEIRERLRQLGGGELPILYLSRENKGSVDQSAFLENPNVECQKYLAVIHTPVIGSGVSITANHFEESHGLFFGVVAHNEALQMLARARTVKNISVSSKEIVREPALSANDLIAGWNASRKRWAPGTSADGVDVWRARFLAKREADLSEPTANFYWAAELKGYTVAAREGVPAAVPAEAKREIKAIIKAAREDAILTAREISNAEAKEIRSSHAPCQEDSHALVRHDVAAIVGKAPGEELTREDVQFFEAGHGSAVKNAELLEQADAELIASDAANAVTKERAYSLITRKKFGLAALAATRAASGGGGVDAQTAAAILSFFAQHWEEIAAAGLGRYQHASRYPVRRLNEFLKRYGHALKRDTEKGKGLYTLTQDPAVAEALRRRAALAAAKRGFDPAGVFSLAA